MSKKDVKKCTTYLASDIKIDQSYMAEIGGKLVPVRINSVCRRGGWNAKNLKTGYSCHVKTVAKIRGEVKGAGADKAGRKPPSERTKDMIHVEQAKRILLILATEPMGEGLEFTAQMDYATLHRRTGLKARDLGKTLVRLTTGRDPKMAKGSGGDYYLTSAGKTLAQRLLKEAEEQTRRLKGKKVATLPAQATPAKSKTAKASKDTDNRPGAVPAKQGGLTIAAEYLKGHPEPMKVKPLSEAIIASGEWSPAGKTPWATLNAAIQREITNKPDDSRFVKVSRGLFCHESHAGQSGE